MIQCVTSPEMAPFQASRVKCQVLLEWVCEYAYMEMQAVRWLQWEGEREWTAGVVAICHSGAR